MSIFVFVSPILFSQKSSIPLRVSQQEATLVSLPIIFYNPTHSLGLGALLVFDFYANNRVSKKSNVQLYRSYTLKEYLLAGARHFICLSDGEYLLKGQLDYKDFSEDIYGQGGRVVEFVNQALSYQLLSFSQSLLKRFKQTNYYIGLSYLYENYWDTDFDGLCLQQSSFLKNEENTLIRSALAFGLVFDDRDNANSSCSVRYVNFQFRVDLTDIGSTQNASEAIVDYRHYHLLNSQKKHVLAWGVYMHYTLGSVACLALPKIGEHSTARGFKEGRYHADFLTSMEIEYRFHLFLNLINGFLKEYE